MKVASRNPGTSAQLGRILILERATFLPISLLNAHRLIVYIDHGIENPCVGGSIPPPATRFPRSS
jgi:hypothetical protein